jgi:hypothetical protein
MFQEIKTTEKYMGAFLSILLLMMFFGWKDECYKENPTDFVRCNSGGRYRDKLGKS